MNANTEAKFKPFESPAARDYSDVKVTNPNANVEGGEDKGAGKASFRDVLMNSNDDTVRGRVAQKNGDVQRAAKSDEEFAKIMADKANKDNVRKPQNELDKDAFLKLFVTQMRNQDPLSPDNSTQMAAQLAQFHGLEQMMNVNKNLEKMQTDDATGRAVGLINFVGKDIKLNNGKLLVEHGGLASEASLHLDHDAAKANLEIRDAAGVVVADEEMGPVSGGDSKLQWSGRGKNGKPLADGAYTFTVTATDLSSQPVDAKITSTVQVTGVDLRDAGGSFFTPIGKVAIRDVASVGTAGYAAADARSLAASANGAAAAKALGQNQAKPGLAPGMDIPMQARDSGHSPGPDSGAVAGSQIDPAQIRAAAEQAMRNASGAGAGEGDPSGQNKKSARAEPAVGASALPPPVMQKPLAMNPLAKAPDASSAGHKERPM